VPTTLAGELVGTAHPTFCEPPYLLGKAFRTQRLKPPLSVDEVVQLAFSGRFRRLEACSR